MKAFWFEAKGDYVNLDVRASLTPMEAREVVKLLLDHGFSMKTPKLEDYSPRALEPRTILQWIQHAVRIRALEGGPYDTWEIAERLKALGWESPSRAAHKMVARELRREEDCEVNSIFRWNSDGERGRARYWFGSAIGTPVEKMTRRFAPEQLRLGLVG